MAPPGFGIPYFEYSKAKFAPLAPAEQVNDCKQAKFAGLAALGA
jgi:hypothetical protein